MAEVKEIVTAFKAAELANLSPDELIELEKREKYTLAKEASIEMAREEGRRDVKVRLAKKLLATGLMSLEEIAVLVELSLPEVWGIQRSEQGG